MSKHRFSRYLELLRILGSVGLGNYIKIAKYLILNRSQPITIHGRTVKLYTLPHFNSRFRYALSHLIEMYLYDLVHRGEVSRAAKVLGLDGARYEECDVLCILGGIRLRAPKEEALQLLYQVRQIYINKIYGAPRGGVVIDVGSWIGDTVVFFALNDNYVIAVEPSARYVEYLMKNIASNGVGNLVKVVRAPYKVDQGINLRLLVAMAEELGGNREIYLKVDCEGCEYEMLSELRVPGIRNRIKYIAMEIHRKSGLEHELLETLSKYFRLSIVCESPRTIVIRGPASH